MEIIPAILTSDPQELDKHLKILRDGKQYERVQIDFIDGQFADNETIHPVQSDLIPYLPLKFDAHLMVRGDNVLFWGKECEQMGFDRVYYQVESLVAPIDKPFLALDVDSPVEKLGDLKDVQGIIVMTVKAGFAGQEFVDSAIEHIQTLITARQNKNYTYEICVDGGIDQIHMNQLETLGVDAVAIGVHRILEWKS